MKKLRSRKKKKEKNDISDEYDKKKGLIKHNEDIGMETIVLELRLEFILFTSVFNVQASSLFSTGLFFLCMCACTKC